MFFYNIGIFLYGFAIRLAAHFNGKAAQWVSGRRDMFPGLAAAFSKGDKVIWMHCASLGEFEQGRPVLERLRSLYPQRKILLTFFSPSGYNIRKDYPGADAVFYLPLDTPRNVRRFLDAVDCQVAIFVKYEFWLNYLRELGRRNIRTYIVSAIFRENSVFFRPYGGIFRRGLASFDTIFVQNVTSRELLAGIGIDNVIVSGDTRFDRVAAIPDTASALPLAARFAAGSKVLVAGSTWPRDEELILEFMSAYPDVKVILAPHEPDSTRIGQMINDPALGAVRFTAGEDQPGVDSAKLLIIDTIGLLSALYRYGKYAYIGGGFGAGIHNTLEAAVFGLPVAFGPNYGKFREARQLIELGAARSVSGLAELEGWYTCLEDSPVEYAGAKAKALSYIYANKGATDTIVGVISQKLR
ncbi:MAG: 3-deoxy-D-manno-octulosonic acid transferase [Rikenellaceae bacterium]|nr:3-deoxy-D-manno-octulosonic acid transferase [Rikenellaceae bacterium]